MTELRRLEFFELVLPQCTRVYGTSPCTASIGTTGAYKCYNSPATCQDHANYDAGEQVIRWALPTEDLPVDYDYIPSITKISLRAQEVKPGESLSTRESLTASFFDHAHNDVIFDKYIDDRDFNPFNVGSFWPRFAVRWPNIQGFEARYVRGFVGQSLEVMERYYFVADSSSGPDSSNGYSITCKDALKFLDNDKAVVPLPSSGVLLASISDSATSLTLSPTGIGNAEYPSSGVASIGDEKVTFTRSGDVVTLTGRGLSGSKQDEHTEGETFQIAEVFDAVETSEIIERLISNFTDTPAEYIDLSGWQAETVTHIGRLYSSEIMKPTGVKKLIDELVEQVGLLVYTSTRAKKIRVKVLRNLVPLMSVTDDIVLEGSITTKTENEKRISAVMTFYAQKNPLENIDQEKNYNAIKYTINADPVAALEGSPFAIKKIFSRWINIFNRPAAESLNDSLILRYGRAPRTVAFMLPAGIELEPGAVFTVQSHRFCDAQGFIAPPVTCQSLSVEITETGLTVLGEEISSVALSPEDGIFRIYIDQDSFNLNLRTVFDSIYVPPADGDIVKFFISAGVKVGSMSVASPAIDVGSWPSAVVVEIYLESVESRVQGKGGNAGYGLGSNGQQGGVALYTRKFITLYGSGKIFGGGGGGPGAQYPGFGSYQYGGGGAGYLAGSGASSGSLDLGGHGLPWGSDGGDPGEAGIDNGFGLAGSGGAAVDGDSYITYMDSPDIRGSQIN
jgi:hypothetical protein